MICLCKSGLSLVAAFNGIRSFNFHLLSEGLSILDHLDLHIVMHLLQGLVLALLRRKTLLLDVELICLSLAELHVGGDGRVYLIARINSISRSWTCGV